MEYLTRHLEALRPTKYEGVMLVPGDKFVAASPVDEGYLVSRGRARVVPAKADFVDAPAVAHVVEVTPEVGLEVAPEAYSESPTEAAQPDAESTEAGEPAAPVARRRGRPPRQVAPE